MPRPITGSPSGSSTGPALTVAHIRPTYFAEWLLYLAPMIEGTAPRAVRHRQARPDRRRGPGPRDRRHPRRPRAAPGQSLSALRPGRIHVPGDRAGPEPGARQARRVQAGQFRGSSRSSGRAERRNQATSSPPGHCRRFERAAKRAAGNSFLFQHLREVAIDHQNGIFAGTNDLVEKLGGRPPMTLEAFIEKHRAAFASDADLISNTREVHHDRIALDRHVADGDHGRRGCPVTLGLSGRPEEERLLASCWSVVEGEGQPSRPAAA